MRMIAVIFSSQCHSVHVSAFSLFVNGAKWLIKSVEVTDWNWYRISPMNLTNWNPNRTWKRSATWEMAPKQVKVNEFFQSSVRPSLGRNFHLFQRIFSFDFFLFLRVSHVRYDIVLPLAIYSTSAFVLSVQRNVNRVQKPSDGRRTGGGREEDAKRGPSVQNMAIKY